MAFILYFIVVLLSAATVIFGLDLAISPLPRTQKVPIGRVAHTPPPAPKQAGNGEKRSGNRALAGVYPRGPAASKGEAAQEAAGRAASKQVSNKEWLPPAPPIPNQQSAEAPFQPDEKNAAATMASNATQRQDARPQPPAVQSSALCDVAACDATYRSFRASDCSYQPSHGSRRFCRKSGGAVNGSAPSRRRRYQGAEPGDVSSRSARNQHEIDTITRIVRQMTPGQLGDIAVSDSNVRIVIVHPGNARAYSGYGNDNNN